MMPFTSGTAAAVALAFAFAWRLRGRRRLARVVDARRGDVAAVRAGLGRDRLLGLAVVERLRLPGGRLERRGTVRAVAVGRALAGVRRRRRAEVGRTGVVRNGRV